jgi:hypothetical protein
MTERISDEELQAFLSGTLDEAAAARIEAAINADPDLADRAERLADTGWQEQWVAQAFAPVLGAPVPEALAAMVASDAPADDTIVDLAAVRAQRQAEQVSKPAMSVSSWRWPQYGAIAASLVVGVVLGGTLLDTSGTDGGDALVLAIADGLNVPAGVAAMLDTAASAEPVDLASLGQGEVVLTFRDGDNRLCRQFAMTDGSGTSDALACRSDSKWQLEALGRRAAPAGEMRTAGGDAAAAVVTAVDELIVGDPIVGEAEQKQLAEQ